MSKLSGGLQSIQEIGLCPLPPDPQTKHANIYTRNTAQKVDDGILTTTNPDITVNLHELK